MEFHYDVMLMILGMVIVAYIPRVIPVFFAEKIKVGEKFEKFLNLIPYTALTCLVFPGILTTDQDKVYVGLIGGAVAGVLAWFKCPAIICVIAAIATDFLIYLIV